MELRLTKIGQRIFTLLTIMAIIGNKSLIIQACGNHSNLPNQPEDMKDFLQDKRSQAKLAFKKNTGTDRITQEQPL